MKSETLVGYALLIEHHKEHHAELDAKDTELAAVRSVLADRDAEIIDLRLRNDKLAERVAELEGYIDQHNARVLSEENPVVALTERVKVLEAALKKTVNKLDNICTYCDDGFVSDEEWDIIADAHAALLEGAK